MKKISIAFAIVSLTLITSLGLKAQTSPITRNQAWSTSVSMLAADTLKVIQAAPGTGRTLYLTYLNCTVTTTAAQTVNVESTGGAVAYLKLAVSPTVNTQYSVGPLTFGLPAPVNTAIQITPSAAGPAMTCVAEGYVTSTGV
jgi:hypothetical protein